MTCECIHVTRPSVLMARVGAHLTENRMSAVILTLMHYRARKQAKEEIRRQYGSSKLRQQAKRREALREDLVDPIHAHLSECLGADLIALRLRLNVLDVAALTFTPRALRAFKAVSIQAPQCP